MIRDEVDTDDRGNLGPCMTPGDNLPLCSQLQARMHFLVDQV